jgi:Kazal-type serine protease inhibitor domain.
MLCIPKQRSQNLLHLCKSMRSGHSCCYCPRDQWQLIINFRSLSAIISLTSLETSAYGYYPHIEPQNHNPTFASSPVANYARRESLTSRDSDFSFKENISLKRDVFLSRKPGIHGPKTDNSASNFRPPGQTQLLDGDGDRFARPSLKNSVVRRRQIGSNANRRPSLFLPPAPDDPDDIFIFDRPTSPNPRPVTTVSSTTTTTARNCNCPSTPEYNPVCGSDGTTYTNPGKLKCAIFCGTGNLLSPTE